MKKIIIGKSGSGKSFRCFKMAEAYQGTVLYFNGLEDSDRYYLSREDLSEIFSKMILIGEDPILQNKKYFLPATAEKLRWANNHRYLSNYHPYTVETVLKPVGRKKALIIMDDDFWLRYQNREKVLYNLWKLSRCKQDVVITAMDWQGLLFDKYSVANVNKWKSVLKLLGWEVEELN